MIYSLGMMSNWSLIAFSFLSARELVLQARSYSNHRRNIPNWSVRDKDDLIASTFAGTLVGSVLAYKWRGPYAIPAGILAYGSLSISAQYGVSSLRHWRQRQGQLLENEAANPSEKVITPFSPDYWRSANQFRDNPNFDREESTLDPIKDLFLWSVSKMKTLVNLEGDDVPAWASPFANALDLEYRHKLNLRIQVLERYVQQLETN
ncbi:hypothetical protein HK096_001344, partial [Nowakowskiella sp. JEL0078]